MPIKEINKSVHIKEFYNLAIIRNKQNCGIIVTSIGMFLSFLLFSSSFSFFPLFFNKFSTRDTLSRVETTYISSCSVTHRETLLHPS